MNCFTGGTLTNKIFAKELGLHQLLVTLASSFIKSNLVRTRIVGSLLSSYCKCCRRRTDLPSCNRHHHHYHCYQHNHYHYYLHNYYHYHYHNNGIHVVIIRVVNNQDFTLTTANNVPIFRVFSPPILARWFMFYLNSSFIPCWTMWPAPLLLLGFGWGWLFPRFHHALTNLKKWKTVIHKNYEDPLTLSLVMDE